MLTELLAKKQPTQGARVSVFIVSALESFPLGISYCLVYLLVFVLCSYVYITIVGENTTKCKGKQSSIKQFRKISFHRLVTAD